MSDATTQAVSATPDAGQAASPQAEGPEHGLNPHMKVFTLRVASNKEDRVHAALERKRRIEGLENKIGRVIVPVKKVAQVKNGKRIYVDQKNYPGYVFIEIEPDEHGRIPQDVWFMVKETEGVGDFIQASGKPHVMTHDEALRMIGESERKDDPEPETAYKKGDRIKVIVGAFEGFEGEVDEVLDKGQVRIITTIFGRPTPLEVTFEEIERL
jgi:transcriptional antiterminator NusG